jgi:hypothetical protein
MVQWIVKSKRVARERGRTTAQQLKTVILRMNLMFNIKGINAFAEYFLAKKREDNL